LNRKSYYHINQDTAEPGIDPISVNTMDKKELVLGNWKEVLEKTV
jgi:hypothetical protein